MLSRKQYGSRVFSRNPETSLPTLPLSSGTGNEIDETWRGTNVRRMLCVNHLFYQLGRFWVLGVEDTDMEDDELQVYFKWTLCSIDLLLFEMHIRQKFQWTSEQLKSVYLDLQYSRLPITRTLANSNLALTRTKIDFPWISVIHSLYFTLGNSNPR